MLAMTCGPIKLETAIVTTTQIPTSATMTKGIAAEYMLIRNGVICASACLRFPLHETFLHYSM